MVFIVKLFIFKPMLGLFVDLCAIRRLLGFGVLKEDSAQFEYALVRARF